MFKWIQFYFNCYKNSKTIIHETNLDKTISFFNLEKKKLKFTLSDENDNCSCNIAKYHVIQCTQMINYNILFNLQHIGKCWYKIIQLFNHTI